MKFLLDHDVPVDVARLLAFWGHDVTLLKNVVPITTPDREVFNHAQTNKCIILSCNRGHFLALAEEAIREQRDFSGLIVLIRRRSRQSECAHLLRLLRQAEEEGLRGNINFA